jgi:hypothetical protein
MDQLLRCTDGEGYVVGRDGTVIHMRPRDTVWTPPGEEHWHGATEGNLMCHDALLEGTGDGDGTTWLEPVTDEQYRQAHTGSTPRHRHAAGLGHGEYPAERVPSGFVVTASVAGL